ncbi:MAG: hypothetical protein ABR968_05335 [Bacteroidales bacterium]
MKDSKFHPIISEKSYKTAKKALNDAIIDVKAKSCMAFNYTFLNTLFAKGLKFYNFREIKDYICKSKATDLRRIALTM